jgi:hypothetical protein
MQPKAFFTVDDGKTYFVDSAWRVPPFTTAEGKTAYRVKLAQCGKSAPFVSYLEKYSDADKKRMEEQLQQPTTPGNSYFMAAAGDDRFVIVKKPLTGDKGWVAFSSKTAKQYDAITRAKCPDGSLARPVQPN